MASTCLLLHKPYGVLSQFTHEAGSRWDCLASFVPVKGVYAAGRLDADSEGLLLLTSDGGLQHQLTNPRFGHWRQYRAQVEGAPTEADLEPLRRGLQLKDGPSRPARAQLLDPEVATAIAERNPPIRQRLSVPTAWLQLELTEGRNRQVRRMTAAIGFPTLRLIRWSLDLMDGQPPLSLEGLEPGQWRWLSRLETKRMANLRS
ncbi:pseudouridine synthase [Synechococcus sp. MIT S9452]|uniref:pseudouridine synthase n=1 Tax=Synechococcus sp. MIT S9452 TaxID=3082546 RepID=UPI0039A677F5